MNPTSRYKGLHHIISLLECKTSLEIIIICRAANNFLLLNVMVPMLDGNSEIGAYVGREIGF